MAKNERKYTHEELHRDEVAEGIHKAWEFVYGLRNVIIVGFVLIVVVMGLLYMRNTQREEKYSNATLAFQELLNGLENLEGQTLQEDRANQYDSVVSTAQNLIDNYGKTEMGKWGYFFLGQAHFQQAEYKRAITAYNNFLNRASNNEEKAQAHIGLGYSRENSVFFETQPDVQEKALNEALENFDEAIKLTDDDSYLNYWAKMSRARILELRGENDEALALLDSLLENPTIESPELPEDIDTGNEIEDGIANRVRQQIYNYRDQHRLAKTVELRQERLRAKMGLEDTTQIFTGGDE